MPPRLKLRDIAFFERPVHFARPFRFGAITINATPQLFVRVEIEVEGKGTAVGASAELLVPKWFDKRPELSPAQTVDDLRRSLEIARRLYLARTGFLTAFDLHASCIGAQVATCAKKNIPALAAAYGPAEIDKAVLDALLRAAETSFFEGMAGNIAGIDARLSPDLKETDLTTFLSGRKPVSRVAIRHTVGLDDTVEGEGGVADARDNSGARYFKLKLSGDPVADAARLARIGKELDTLGRDYKATLDANEQYADLAALQALMDRLDRDPTLRPIASRLLYVEQPMPRDITRQSPLGSLAARGFIIDEADDSYDAFPAAPGARLLRHLLEVLQGALQVHRQRDACGEMERGRRKILRHRRRSHLSGGSCRAAGPRARRLPWHHARRAQRPSLCRRLWRGARRRSRGLRGSTSRSLRRCRAGHPALHSQRRSPDGIAQPSGFCDVGPSGLVGTAPARTAKIT
ncbi:hypothetical protein ACVWYI_002909 [Bradyrhizobium sp. LB13.1]